MALAEDKRPQAKLHIELKWFALQRHCDVV
jgi:hypothetical protein